MPHLVLVGGGHAHLFVMEAFGRHKAQGLTITLITQDLKTPYSGMVPGCMAGLYQQEDVEIDLAHLAGTYGFNLIHGQVIGFDPDRKQLFLKDRAPVSYDLLSINIGITPDFTGIAGADEYGIAVKPIHGLLQNWTAALNRALTPPGPRSFCIIGGGAAGVEIAFAIRARLQKEAPKAGIDPAAFHITILARSGLLQGFGSLMRHSVAKSLRQADIRFVPDFMVTHLSKSAALAADGRRCAADIMFISTAAHAPACLANSPFARMDDGCLAVRSTLQVGRYEDVFAAGDCATMIETPHAKAGVFAVRQGPVLAENLRRSLDQKPLVIFTPQRHVLSLINTGQGRAIGGKGLFATGNWAFMWRLKDWIDRRFMRRFQHPST